MEVLKTMEEWANAPKPIVEQTLYERQMAKYEALNEDEYVDVDIMLDDKPEKIEMQLKDMEGVGKTTVFDFGVIKARVKKKLVELIKRISGVETVEVIH